MYSIASPYYEYYYSMSKTALYYESKFKNEIWYFLFKSLDSTNIYISLVIITDMKFLNAFNSIEELLFIRQALERAYSSSRNKSYKSSSFNPILNCAIQCKFIKFYLKLNKRLQILLKNERAKENI